MKTLGLLCVVFALAILILGLITKYLFPLASARPMSYLALAQMLLLLGINFTLLELIKK